MSGNLKNQRKHGKGGFAQAHIEVFDSPECKALSKEAQLVLFRLLLKCNPPSRNGELAYSINQVAADCRIDRATARAKFKELQRAGFIEQARVYPKNQRKATEYRLTFFPSANGKQPTDDWKG